ncbi:hypothetical protein TA3x_003973 [Tundrisphaera sp. TA3]|uniref:hypothetical protein n=1 Tax=Tundrisphaera sp. TA3 TaxID=3435775 RepID=UPI003EB924E6
MRLPYRRIGKTLIIIMILALGPAGYWLGYRDGLRDRGTQMRAIVLVRRKPGTNQPSGQSYLWYHIGNPLDVMRMRAKEAELKEAKAEYYVAKGKLESTLTIEPDPRRATAHP